MTRTVAPWREPSATDRCTTAVAAVARDLFTWHRRGVTVRMVEPTRDGGVLLGVWGVGTRVIKHIIHGWLTAAVAAKAAAEGVDKGNPMMMSALRALQRYANSK